MDTWGLKWCYFYAYQPPPPPNDVTFHAYQSDNTIAMNAYQNDVTFYAYRPPPQLNDVAFDAYQLYDIAINAYQVWKKMKSVFLKTICQLGCGLSGWSFFSRQKQTILLLDLSVLVIVWHSNSGKRGIFMYL